MQYISDICYIYYMTHFILTIFGEVGGLQGPPGNALTTMELHSIVTLAVRPASGLSEPQSPMVPILQFLATMLG